ncbi:MAG: hypothetical protein V5A21_04190 [Halapricum sp.]
MGEKSYHSDRRSKVSRRAVLKRGLASSIVGVGGLTGQVAAAERSTGGNTEITIVARGDEPVVTQTVPRAWYEHVSAVDRAARVLADRFVGTQGVEHLRRVRTEGNIEGHGRLGVAVLVGDDGAADSIPAEINGVSVEARHAKPQTFTDDLGNVGSTSCTTESGKEEEESSIPGGVAVKPNSDKQPTTTTCKARKNGTDYLLTCAHMLFDGGSVCDGFGEQIYSEIIHPTSETTDQIIGNVVETSTAEYDYALAEATEEISSVSRDIDGYSGSVSGHVTADGFSYLLSNNDSETLYRSGIKTGLSEGPVTAVSFDDQITWKWGECSRGHRFECDVGVIGGDSGGTFFFPYYEAGSLKLAVAGIQSTGKDKNLPDHDNDCTTFDESVAIRADQLHEQKGIDFYGFGRGGY